MSRPIINIAGVEREMNDEEFAQYELDQSENEKREAALRKREEIRAAILEKIGLTEEEVRLLLG